MVSISALATASGMAEAGMGVGERPKARLPSTRPTCRSCQPSALRMNWRMGRASKNSLAMTSTGPSSKLSKSWSHLGS
ncbi:hypothetical protein D3C86_2126450 [compost metagenome]